MNNILDWLYTNRSWIFDGIGVLIISTVITFWWHRRKEDNKTQNQVGGDNSVNIQSAGNITISNQARESNGKRTKSNKRQ